MTSSDRLSRDAVDGILPQLGYEVREDPLVGMVFYSTSVPGQSLLIEYYEGQVYWSDLQPDLADAGVEGTFSALAE